MQKHINKKVLFLLFGFTTLTFFNSVSPTCNLLNFIASTFCSATHKLSSCFKKCIQPNPENSPAKSTATTIEDLPNDCLFEILGFIGYANKEILNLRLINKWFGSMIKISQNFLDCRNRALNTYMNKQNFNVLVKGFCGKRLISPRNPDLTIVSAFGFSHLYVPKTLVVILNSISPNIKSRTKNYFELEEMECGSISIEYPCYDTSFYYLTKNQDNQVCKVRVKPNKICVKRKNYELATKFICNKHMVYNDKFKIELFLSSFFCEKPLSNIIKKLVISKCENFETPIVWPENLMELKISYCPNFKIEYLENLSNLLSLSLKNNDGICKDNALKKVGLKNLKSLSISCYPYFTGKGLPKKLTELRVKYCENFDKNSKKNLPHLKHFSHMQGNKCSIL